MEHFDSPHMHGNVVGDARKRLESDNEPPFSTGNQCAIPGCYMRIAHTHVPPTHLSPILATYPGYDPT